MKSVTQVLRKARALLSDKAKWTKGVYARNASGNSALLSRPEAVCFCAMGAVYRVAGDNGEPSPLVDDARSILLKNLPSGRICTVAEYNDDPHTTHQDILDLFDRAIAAGKN